MGSAERILVVEDDDLICALFKQLLPSHGLEAVIAQTAERATEILEVEEIDLVIADKNLPGMSGVDLLEWVKARNPDLDVIIAPIG